MDLRYSDEDEAFRDRGPGLARRPRSRARPAAAARRLGGAGAPTTPAWQRKLYDAGLRRACTGRSSPAAAGLPITQQLVYLEEYARADAPYISVNFVGMMHAGPTLIAEGTDEQRRFHLPRILRGETSGARASPSPRPGPTSPRCAPGPCATATTTSCPARRSGAPGPTSPTGASCSCAPIPTRRSTRASPGSSSTCASPGVEVRPMRTIDGESHFCEVFLDEVRVPVSQPGRRRERRLAGHQRDPALRAGHRVRAAHHHDAGPAAEARRAGRRRRPRRRNAWDDSGAAQRRSVGSRPPSRRSGG